MQHAFLLRACKAVSKFFRVIAIKPAKIKLLKIEIRTPDPSSDTAKGIAFTNP
jgi:hypothetical protein